MPAESSSPDRGGERSLIVLLALCLLVTLALGVAKLEIVKANPPFWTSPTLNTYHGYVAIDRYCDRAEVIRSWMTGDEGGGEAVVRNLRWAGHATALLVPAAIAFVSLGTGSIVVSFAALSYGALLAQIVLAVFLARRCARGSGGRAGITAAILIAAHCDSARTSAQLILDQFTAVAATLVLLLTLRWLEKRSLARAALLFGCVLLVPYLKVAALPILGVPAGVALIVPRAGRIRLAAIALSFGVASFALMHLACAWILDQPVLSPEVASMLRSNKPTGGTVAHFAMEMGLLFQLLPLALFVVPSAITRTTMGTLAIAGLMFLSVAAVILHDDMRLYLPVLGLFAAAAAPSVARALAGWRLVGALGLFAAGNLAVAAWGLLGKAG